MRHCSPLDCWSFALPFSPVWNIGWQQATKRELEEMSIPGIQGREATTAATAAVVASPSRRSTGLRPIHRWRRRRKPGRARARRGHSGSGRAEQKRRRVERGQRRQRAARAGGTSAVGRRAAESGFRRMRRQQVVGAGDLVHHAAEAGGVGGDVGGGQQLPRRAPAAFCGASGCGSRGAEQWRI